MKIRFIDIAFIALILIFFATLGWQTNFETRGIIDEKCDVGVIFGAGITKSGTPSPALKYRLEKAIELYKSGNLKKLLTSGRIPETIVMKNYLLSKGIKLEDIIIDIKGESTAATLRNIKRLQQGEDKDLSVAFISQKYHLARIFILANKYRIKNFYLVATETKEIDRFENLIVNLRETFAIFKSIVFE
ncbi:MAG: ElyC/SanA/YdcF family protein [Brevinematia bacterium]